MPYVVLCTKVILVVLAAFLVIYDIVALWLGGWDATISVVLLTWARSYPILPFAFGVVCGHLFWPQKVTE